MIEASRHLPIGYCLLNFETVLREVRSRYADLLHDEELRWMEGFLGLPLDARRLHARMLTRKGPWFREDALDYGEIKNRREALETLCATGFCESCASLEELVPLLVREELALCLHRWQLPFAKNLRREALVRRLLEGSDHGALEAELRAQLRPVKLLHAELWSLLCFLFFGNGEQDLSSFVLADIGQIRYEAYALDTESRLFQSRRDVDFLLSLSALKHAFEDAVLEKDRDAMRTLTDQVLAMDPHPGVRQQRRYHRLLNDLGRAWEQGKEPVLALACYSRSHLPPARERIARIQVDVPLAIRMAEAPLDLSEERFARVFLKRHGRRVPEAAQWVREHPVTESLPERHFTLPRQASVEQAALEAAGREGWDGFFAENILWNALFGLAFWEELFAPVPGAFQHRFQFAPQDIGHPDFYARRRDLMERRLAEIQEGEAFMHRVLATADAKWGVANAFLSWRQLSRKMLEAALQRVPPLVMATVLRTLAQSPRGFSRGFPDLFLFKPQGPEWALWEVKGPGDSLRPEQERWLKQLNQMGCDVQVAHVKWVDAQSVQSATP